MRNHGYPRFPGPDSAGNFNLTGINLNTPRGRSAGGACSSQVAPGNPNPGQQNAQALSQALKFSRCMRAHGVMNFPDPNPDGQNSFSNSNTQVPLVRRALTACHRLLAGASSAGGSTP